jgi:hypothetical protein
MLSVDDDEFERLLKQQRYGDAIERLIQQQRGDRRRHDPIIALIIASG